MDKILRISPILISIVLSFYSISFGDQLAKSSTNYSNEMIYGKWILHQEGEAPLLSPERAESGSNLHGANLSQAISNREFFMNPENTNRRQSPATTEIQKKDLYLFEDGQLSKGKSRCHFGKIHLTKNNLDPSLEFIPILSLAQYKEENPGFWTLEKFRGDDIFKSIAIILEFNLNF
jgi:hypothetical protein